MLVKTILVFLLAMVLIGMIGKALFPGAARRLTRRGPAPAALRCPECGRPRIGKGCPCEARRG
jgi:hypothetical protein